MRMKDETDGEEEEDEDADGMGAPGTDPKSINTLARLVARDPEELQKLPPDVLMPLVETAGEARAVGVLLLGKDGA